MLQIEKLNNYSYAYTTPLGPVIIKYVKYPDTRPSTEGDTELEGYEGVEWVVEFRDEIWLSLFVWNTCEHPLDMEYEGRRGRKAHSKAMDKLNELLPACAPYAAYQLFNVLDAIIKTAYNDRPGGRPDGQAAWNAVADRWDAHGMEVLDAVTDVLQDLVFSAPEMNPIYSPIEVDICGKRSRHSRPVIK